MHLTSETAIASGESGSSFGAILAGTLLEMERAAAYDLPVEDAVQRLSLEAQHAIASQVAGPLPRAGGHAYLAGTVTAPARTPSQLDVRF